MPKFDLLVKVFKTPKDWENWLAKNYSNPKGIWLRMYKKASGIKTVVYAEALEVALCFGWIDGQTNKYDAKSYLQRFTPRRKRSVWSKRNIEHIARLTKLRRMKPSGLAAVAEAMKNGQWANAYHSPSKMIMPKDFLALLKKDKKAQAFFDTLNQNNRYAIYYRLNSAKKLETRMRRMKQFITMLKNHKKLIG